MLSAEDRKILKYRQEHPSMTMPELCEVTGLSLAKLTRRLERLRVQGVILGQRVRLNWSALGYNVHVSLRVTLDKATSGAFDDFLAAARLIPEVLEIQTFLGQVDVRLSLIAKDLAHYQELYRRHILTLPHMLELEALMTVATVKENKGLPL